MGAMDHGELTKFILVVIASGAIPIIAVEANLAAFGKRSLFHPRELVGSALIMLGLLAVLALAAKTWLLPFPWPGLVLVLPVVIWHFYTKWRLRT